MPATTLTAPRSAETAARVAKAARLIVTLLSAPELVAAGRPDPDATAALGRYGRNRLARQASTFLGEKVNVPSPQTMGLVAEGLRRIYAGTMAF